MEQVSKTYIDIPDRITLPEFILNNCSKHGSRIAVIDPITDESWTYNEFIDKVSICSSALSGLGIRSRDKVCLFLPNCIQYPVLYLAIMKIGAVCVPVNHTSSSYELDYYVEDSGPVVLVACSSNIQVVDEIICSHASKSMKSSGFEKLKEIIILKTSSSSPSSSSYLSNRYIDFHMLMSRTEGLSEYTHPVEAREDTMDIELSRSVVSSPVATICYSSGTTGKPKGCEQTHCSYIANTLMQSHPSLELNPTGQGVTIAVLPMFHMFGQLVYLTHALYDGITMVVCDRFSPKEYLQLVNKYQATYLHVVPPLVASITAYIEQIQNNRLATSGVPTNISPLAASTAATWGASATETIATSTAARTTVTRPTTAAKTYTDAATVATAATAAATSAAAADTAAATVSTAAARVAIAAAARVATVDASSDYMRSVRCILSAAASLVPSVGDRFSNLFPWISLIQGFGMTETMLAFVSSPTSNRVESCGKLMANCRAKVVDPTTGQLLGSRQTGEILIYTPSVMKGYLNNEEAFRNSFDSSSYLKTGDVGYYDEDGYFYIVGRIKEHLRYKGHQIAPIELETVLLKHPGVTDAAVIGIPDEVCGDLPRAYVVLHSNSRYLATPSVNELVDFVHAHVSPHKYLRGGLEITDSIPKNPSGKILRRVLLERAMSGSSKAKL